MGFCRVEKAELEQTYEELRPWMERDPPDLERATGLLQALMAQTASFHDQSAQERLERWKDSDNVYDLLGHWRKNDLWRQHAIMSLIALPALAFGVGFVIYGLFHLQKGRASLSWPTVEGEIVISKMVSQPDMGKTRKLAHIQYVYEVKGRRYTSEEISFKGVEMDYDDSKRLLADYPKGKRVTVYYNPENPGEAVLQPGADASTWLPLAIGLICTTAALALILFFLIHRWRKTVAFRREREHLRGGVVRSR